MSVDSEFRHLCVKARDAARGGYEAWRVQSTGERLAVAVVLNRPEWIAEMGYTLAEAIDRIGIEWLALVLKAETFLAAEGLGPGAGS